MNCSYAACTYTVLIFCLETKKRGTFHPCPHRQSGEIRNVSKQNASPVYIQYINWNVHSTDAMLSDLAISLVATLQRPPRINSHCSLSEY
jgi:hypothetical protein